jgi:hypothetical protein
MVFKDELAYLNFGAWEHAQMRGRHVARERKLSFSSRCRLS